MKPVGLADPHQGGTRPYAVVQLRQDNALGSLWNMVGFQTKLKHGEQVRIFRMIPGLQAAEFARLGGLHRNTFLNSPKLLDAQSALEGDAAPALCRADHRRRRLRGKRRHRAPRRTLRGRRALGPRLHAATAATTALGALLAHITGGHLLDDEREARARSFQPMNINHGLLPPIEAPEQTPTASASRARTRAAPRSARSPLRALADLDRWLALAGRAAAE